MTRDRLSCDLHDYLEIACMYQLLVKLHLISGDALTGVPVTIKVDSNKNELLVFAHNDDSNTNQYGQEIDIPVLSIARMQALTQNPHFEEIDFLAP